MKILIISPFLPYPPDKGTSIRNWNLIKQLDGQCQFSLLVLINSPEQRSFAPYLEGLCQGVETVLLRREPKLRHLPGVMRCLLSGQPVMNKFVRVDEMARKVEEWTRAHDFDIINIDGSSMAPYVECIDASSRAKTALTFIDIESVKLRRRLSIEKSASSTARNLIDWAMMRRWEAKYAERFDMCFTMSDLDAQLLKRMNPRLNVTAIPNGVDVCLYRPLPECNEPGRILLIGYMHHPPWEDAVLYFHREVFPHVRRQVPSAKMLIVGEPTQRIKQLESESVEVVGYVDDVRSYYQRSTLSAVPLRAGGGTRLKILEAMALGRPVVSTSIGYEGLDAEPGRHLLVADRSQDLAEHTIRLLRDRALRRHLVENSRDLVVKKYDWVEIGRKLLAVCERETRRIHS